MQIILLKTEVRRVRVSVSHDDHQGNPCQCGFSSTGTGDAIRDDDNESERVRPCSL